MVRIRSIQQPLSVAYTLTPVLGIPGLQGPVFEGFKFSLLEGAGYQQPISDPLDGQSEEQKLQAALRQVRLGNGLEWGAVIRCPARVLITTRAIKWHVLNACFGLHER